MGLLRQGRHLSRTSSRITYRNDIFNNENVERCFATTGGLVLCGDCVVMDFFIEAVLEAVFFNLKVVTSLHVNPKPF